LLEGIKSFEKAIYIYIKDPYASRRVAWSQYAVLRILRTRTHPTARCPRATTDPQPGQAYLRLV